MSLADRIIDHGPYLGGDDSPFAGGVDYTDLNDLRDRLIAGRGGTTYEEWRVTGQPNSFQGMDFPPYSFTWSLRLNPHLGDPEQAARRFIALQADGDNWGTWTDGPHLHKRTVTVTDWQEAEA